MEDLKFRVRAHSENATKTVVKTRGFEMIIDEPTELGGNNEGANPVEYELAAFSGCINVMGHVIAKEMNMDLKSMNIDITGLLNPAKLLGTSMEERAGYKQINVKIKADSSASIEELEKWKQDICERCPVSDNLKNTTPVFVDLKNK